MKTPWILILLLAMVGNSTLAAPIPGDGDRRGAKDKVIVYYFHRTMRCTSCVALETQTVGAIAKAFPEEMKKGILVWRPVNIEDKKHAHFEKDFALETSSVVLVKERKGRRLHWKNLDKVWEIGMKDEQGFSRYIEEEVRSFLKVKQ